MPEAALLEKHLVCMVNSIPDGMRMVNAAEQGLRFEGVETDQPTKGYMTPEDLNMAAL